MQNNTKSNIFALLAVAAWATVASAFKIALSTLQPSQLLLIASATSLVIFTAMLIAKKELGSAFKINRETALLDFAISLLNPTIYYLLLFTAYSLLPGQIALVLNYTWTGFVVLFTAIFLKEKFTLRNYFLLSLGLFGVLLIASKGSIAGFQTNSMFGIICVVLSAIVWAAYWILSKRDKRKVELRFFHSFLISTLLLIIYCLYSQNNFSLNYKSFFAAVYVGVFEMGITFLLWNKALEYTSNTAKTANLIYLSPLLSLLLLNLITNEIISIYTVFGLILIVLSIILQPKTKN